METSAVLLNCTDVQKKSYLDREVKLTSHVWYELCYQLNIQINLSSGYYPQSKGQVGRLIK